MPSGGALYVASHAENCHTSSSWRRLTKCTQYIAQLLIGEWSLLKLMSEIDMDDDCHGIASGQAVLANSCPIPKFMDETRSVDAMTNSYMGRVNALL